MYGTSDLNAIAALQVALREPTLSVGEQLTGFPPSLSYGTNARAQLPVAYTVQDGDTWASIAQALYGTSAVATQLQTALGNPSLTAGSVLTGLPVSLVYPAIWTRYLNIPLTYTVQSGDTYSSIAQTLYGTDDPGVVAQLQSYVEDTLGLDLTPGTQLTNLPKSFDYSTSSTIAAPAGYTVQPGDTWASIAQLFYGTPDAASGLQLALGDITLQPGEYLTNLPSTVLYSTNTSYTAPPYYTVQAGDTWASIATTLYGSATVATELQSALGNPPLDTGEQLNKLPQTLSDGTTTYTAEPFYVVQAGDTWTSIAIALYGTGDSNAVAALQAALGNPTLAPGEVFTNLPQSIPYTTTIVVSVPPYYTVEPGDTWASIAQTLYGTTDAASALETTLGSPTLTTGELLSGFPSTLTYTITTVIPTEPYYTVQSGDTWSSIALALYGNSAVASALETDLGNPTLVAGETLTAFPSQLSYSAFGTFQVAPYYGVQPGDTWASIAQALYGTSAVASQLQQQLGDPPLTVGTQLRNFPATLNYISTVYVTVPPYYTVQASDTWSSIAQTLYGTSAVATQLENALGNPTLTVGEQLTGLPTSLSYTATVTSTVPAYYTVQSGDTWDSITLSVYGSDDANAVAALQSVLGNPTLTAGEQLTVPSSLTYTPSDETYSSQTEITDPLGNITTFVNDSSGRLIEALSPNVNGAPLAVQFSYGADGKVDQVSQVLDGATQSTQYQYDSQGNLILSRDADGDTVTRTYDAADQILTETTYNVADPNGSAALQGGMTTRYVYDADERLRFAISPVGSVTEYTYDSQGNRTSEMVFTDTQYDVSGLSTTAAPTLSQMTTWASSQNLTQLQLTTYTYDFRGQISTVTAYAATDANGNGVSGTGSVTQYVYDQYGNLLQTIDPRGEGDSDSSAYATTYTYDGLGRVLSKTQWVSSTEADTTLYHYDDADNTVTTTLANGLVTTSVYDADDELISTAESTTSGQQFGTTTYTYDADGRLRTVTNPDGVETHTLYDSAGRKVATVDGNGDLTEYVYNAASQVVETIQYAGTVNTAALADVSGQPANVSLATLISEANTNPAQNEITRAVYDSAGRLIYSIDGAGAVTQTVYDGAGQVVASIAYATPVSIPQSAGELQPSDVPVVSTSSDRETRYFYDADGNRIGELDPEGYLTQYQYDDADQLIQQTQYATQSSASLLASGTLAQLTPTSNPSQDITDRFFYDGEGRRTGVIDGDGYLTQTEYDAAGNVTETIRYANPVSYTSGATLASLIPTDTLGAQITEYEYDGDDRVIQETNYQGTVTQYQYDSVGNLISTTVGVDTSTARTTQTRYDAEGHVVATLTAQGSDLITDDMTQAQIDAIWGEYGMTYAYDAAGQRVSMTDQNGLTTYYYYDSDGQQTYTVNAAGDVSHTIYDSLGRVANIIAYDTPISTAGLTGGLVAASDIASRVAAVANATIDSETTTTYGFTAAGRTQTTKTAEGETVTQQYDAFGDVISSVEAITPTSSLETDYTYDKRGKLTRTVTDPDGLDTVDSNEYDAFGRLISTTDADGNVQTFAYDQLGRQVQTVDALGGTTTTTYDAFSRELSVTDALGNVTTYSYDDATRTSTVTSPQGVTLTTADNEFGQTATITDGNGNVTTYTYDANGDLTNTSDSLGTEGSATYDAAGRLLTSTDANGTVTAYTYDAANRVLTQVVDPTGLALTTSYQYDAEGRTITTTNADGVESVTQYDRDGRTTSVTVDPSGLDIRTTYTYDERGDELTVTQGAGTAAARVTQYVYDSLGRRISEIVNPGSGGLNITTNYQYDADNNVVAKVDADGNETRYVYDADNRLTYTIDAYGGVTETDYDADGNLVETRRYATAINVTALTESGPISVAQLSALLAPTSQDRTEQSVYNGDGQAVYSIDALGDVTQNIYDGNGNIVRVIAYATPIAAGTYSTVASIQSALAQVAEDPNAEHVQTTVYDARNRAVFSIDSLGDVTQTSYDGDGNIVQVTHFAATRLTSDLPTDATLQAWVAANADPGVDETTRTWYDTAGRAVLTVDAGGDATVTAYDNLGRVLKTTAYAKQVTIAAGATLSQALSAIVATPSQDQVNQTIYDKAGRTVQTINADGASAYYTYDALGDQLTYTNEAGATWTYQYDAAGRMTHEYDPPVAVTTVTSTNGELSASTSTESLVTYNQYDGMGNLISTTEAYGTSEARTTTYVYDALGRQIRTNFPPMSVYDYAGDDAWDTGGSSARTEMTVDPFSEVTYDTLGDAVADLDVSGDYSYKSYDALGRVTYAIDGSGYVTGYTYDSFGNQTSVTRYANAVGIAANSPPTTAQVQADLTPNSTQDRTIVTVYDPLNRAVRVIQPSVLNFVPAAGASGGDTFNASATTINTYNSFGQLVLQSQLVDLLSNTFANTYYYYDALGNKIASIDALGDISTYQYDAFGNLTQQTDYSKPLASGSWSLAGYPTPTATTAQSSPNDPAGYDRTTQYTYDQMNRKLTQTLVGLQYSQLQGSSMVSVVGNQTTTYTYDALGNETSSTDATGATSYVYYDALGREIASAAAPSNEGNGTTVLALTLMKRDAFGNLVEQVSAANSAVSATATSFQAGAASANDRTTLYLTDAYGNVLQMQDPTGAETFESYYVNGKVAKEWQPVTDDSGSTQYLTTVYVYDADGNEVWTLQRQNSSLIVRTNMIYDAFGEMTSQEVNGDSTDAVYYRYDQAGRLWNTNSNGGIDTVYLYDMAGKATATIKSQQLNLSQYSQGEVAGMTTDVERTETRYDLLGNVVEQRTPAYSQANTNSGLEEIGVPFQIGTVLGPNNPDAVYSYWGGIYTDDFSIPETAYLDPGLLPSQGGGYYYTPPTASDPNGTWTQDPSYALVASRYMYWAQPQTGTSGALSYLGLESGGLNVVATFQYQAAGSPSNSWSTLQVVNLPNGQFGVDTSSLADGSYNYRVTYSQPNELTPYAVATGTMTFDGSTATSTDTTAATLQAQGTTPVAIGSVTQVNTQFEGADFQIGDVSHRGIDQYVYQKVVTGALVDYVPNPAATVADGGGYFLTDSGYVQDPNYTPATARYIYWNAPSDSTLVAGFQYRLTDSTVWTTLPVVTLPNGQLGAAIGDLHAGSYVYKATSSQNGSVVATDTGNFDVQPLVVQNNISVDADPADDAGFVAPISSSPPNVIQSSIVYSSDDGSDFGQYLNNVLVQFPDISGPVKIELQYISDNYDIGPDGELYPTDATSGSASYEAGTPQTMTFYFADASDAQQGLNLLWQNPGEGNEYGRQYDGISAITSISVYQQYNVDQTTAGDSEQHLVYSTEGNPPAAALFWQAPTSPGVTAVFQLRPYGTSQWETAPLEELPNGYYTVDTSELPQGTWEYQVTYTQNGYETAQSGGSFSIAGNAETTPTATDQAALQDTTAPIQALSGTQVENQIASTAKAQYGDATDDSTGYDAQPTVNWSGTNQLDLSWLQSLGSGPIRIDLNYVSASYESFSNVGTGGAAAWQATGLVAGSAQSQSFDFDADGLSDDSPGSNVTTNSAQLEWSDAAGGPGGISSVTGVTVYVQNAQGQWVLAFQNAGQQLPQGPGLLLPTTVGGANGTISAVDFEISPQGEDDWTPITPGANGLINLSGYAAGNYDYEVTYSVTDSTDGSLVPFVQSTGVITIPSDSSPITLTQTNIQLSEADHYDTQNPYPGNYPTPFPVTGNGTTVSWSYTPGAGNYDTVNVLERQAGTSTWTTVTPTYDSDTGTYSVDLGSGAVQYDIQYLSSGTVVAASSGTQSPVVPPLSDGLGGDVGPITGVDNPNVSATIANSATPDGSSGGSSETQTYEAWTGTNQVNMTWANLGSGPVKVVLDYISAQTDNDYDYEDFVNGETPAWITGNSLPGVSAQQTFEFDSAATGATLSWNDPYGSQVGGISQIQQALIYTQDAQGNWVLAADYDANSSVLGTQSLYWPSPQNSSDPNVQQTFQIKAKGTDPWQTVSISNLGEQSGVDLSSFIAGDYDYQLISTYNGSVTDVASGELAIDDSSVGGVMQVSQTNVHLTTPGPIETITGNGTQIAWTEPANTGDSVVVQYCAEGSDTWLTQDVSSQGGPTYIADLSAAGNGPVEFQILYTAAGATTPYLETDGVLNSTLSMDVTQPPDTQITQTADFISLLPLDVTANENGYISWTTPLPSAETILVSYQIPNGSWQTATAVPDAGGWAVDFSSLPPGTYAYKIEYVIAGQAAPAYYASGVIDLTRDISGNGVTLQETTQFYNFTLLQINPDVPDTTQTVDRWGDVLSTTDALGNTTNYRYNQTGQLVDTLQPEMQVTSTANGTVTTTSARPETQNYYDILGRLIGTLDADGNLNTETYNAAGQVLTQSTAAGGTKSFVYNTFGDQVGSTDAMGYRTQSTYDADNRLIEVQTEIVLGALANGYASEIQTQTYKYDQAGRRIAQTDGAGDTTDYYYDLRGNVVKRVDPMGYVTTEQYDDAGHMIEETDPDGNTATWDYNFFGQLLGSTDLGGATYGYTYDNAGDTLTAVSSLGENITYKYDTAGHVIEIDDEGTPTIAGAGLQAADRVTLYGYDKAGNQVTEEVTVNGLIEQDTTMSYDAEGRLVSAVDPMYQLSYEYDAAGNRTHISATYYNHDGYSTSGLQTQDLWYTYDGDNRVLISQGADVNGTVQITTSQGTTLTYNLDGERASAETYGTEIFLQQTYQWWGGYTDTYSTGPGYTNQVYTYDGLGDLLTTTQDGVETDARTYDAAQRETYDSSWSIDANNNSELDLQTQATTYDADGRPMTETTQLNYQTQTVVTYGESTYSGPTTSTYLDPFSTPGGPFIGPPKTGVHVVTVTTPGGWSDGYDAAGNLRGYSVQIYKNGQYQYTDNYTLDYRLGTSYQETEEDVKASTIRSGITLPDSGTETLTYDVDGFLTSKTDSQESSNDRYFATDSNGNTLAAVQGTLDGKGSDLTVAEAFADALTRTTGNNVLSQYFFFVNGQSVGSFGQLEDSSGNFTADFDVNFTPVSPSYPAEVPSTVVAESGDTLRTIAARVFGDATLWYLIAQENGLTDPDASIAAGTELNIPNQVVSLHNNAQTFKPFDPTEAIGSTTQANLSRRHRLIMAAAVCWARC